MELANIENEVTDLDKQKILDPADMNIHVYIYMEVICDLFP